MTTGSIVDYVGRLVDLTAYHGMQPSGDVRLNASLAPTGESGSIVTGVQKVAQRLLTELLKDKGSMPFRPNEGTNFLAEARAGAFQTQADVMSAFQRGVAEVSALLQAEETASDPDDEKFRGAEIVSVDVSPGTAIIKFQLITAAGTNRKFIFPLDVPLAS